MILYTAMGGIKAVTWADVRRCGHPVALVLALVIAICCCRRRLLPRRREHRGRGGQAQRGRLTSIGTIATTCGAA